MSIFGRSVMPVVTVICSETANLSPRTTALRLLSAHVIYAFKFAYLMEFEY